MAAKRGMGPAKSHPKEDLQEYTCYGCGLRRKSSEFYVSSDPFNVVGLVPYCKTCITKIARNYDSKKREFGEVTKTSLQLALERLDKPYIEKLWESSYKEVHDDTLERNRSNIWAAYVKNVQMQNYEGMRWKDGDNFKSDFEKSNQSENLIPQTQEAFDEYQKNKKDVIRLIGYDPFAKELEEDKPLLYAQLIGYIDMSGDNEDMTRILDSIEIVRGYLQLQKINDMSAKAFSNLSATSQSGEIKNYMTTKKQVADVISQLAEQSCISLKYNKNASKGENTFAGKIKKLKELNLRDAEANAFDIETCKGMQQVADISNASIIKQLALDENDYTEMIAKQRDMIVKLKKESSEKTEEARILLRENIDLKKFIEENGIDISEYCVSAEIGEVVD